MQLSRRALRQIENLPKSYEFDMEEHIATIPIHYTSPDKLLDPYLSTPECPVVSDDAIDYLCDLVSDIPAGFNIKFALSIDDYKEYNPTSLMHAIQDTIENTFYYHDENRKINNMLGVIFLVIGLIILVYSIVGRTSGWFGNEQLISYNIIETILEIIVWVFLWEGAALIFFVYDSESTYFNRRIRRLCGIQFINNSGKVICNMDKDLFYKDWIYLNPKEAFARNFILFSNAALISWFAIDALKLFSTVGPVPLTREIFFVINGVLSILMVISNISFYKESGPLRHGAAIISVIALIYIIGALIYSIISASVSYGDIIWNIILIVDLLVNFICIYYMKKQNIEIKNKGI